MSKLGILLKYGTINTLRINRFFKGKKREGKGPIILLLVLGIVFFVIAFIYMTIYGQMFHEGGVDGGIMVLAINLGSIMTALTSATNTNAYLFNPKDFDLLMAMPVKPRTIFLSKAIDLLILNYVTLLYIYVPSMVVYTFYNDVGFMYFVLAIIAFFLIPLLPIAVFGMLSYLFGFLKISLKVKKIIRTILYLALVIGILFVSFSISSGAGDENFALNIYNNLVKVYYPGYLAYEGLRGDYLKYLLFIAISIVPFILFMAFASRSYLKNKSNDNYSVSSKNKEIKIKASSKISTLLKKELRGYFTLPVYVANTVIGPIMGVIGAIFIMIRSKADFVDIGDGKLVEMSVLLPFLVVLILSVASSMSPTTPAAISLEGKNMWIIKSSPINYKDIINSKIFVSYIVTLPFIFIVLIISLIIKRFEWYEYLAILLIPAVNVIIISKIGILFNLNKVILDFDNPAKVIKQTTPVLFTMLISFALVPFLSGLLITLYLITKIKIISYAITLVVLILIYILVSVLLKKVGKKKYEKIVC